MSTRATYQFDGDRHNPRTTVYIHDNGHPEGAAWYFYRTLTNPSKGNLATQFIRANEQAEITSSHDVHADTDCRYSLKGNGPEALLLAQRRTEDDSWECFYSGKLVDFVHEYSGRIKGYQPFRLVKTHYGASVWHNPETARRRLLGPYGPIEHLLRWQQSGVHRPGSANWDACRGDAIGILTVFPELWNDELRGLLA